MARVNIWDSDFISGELSPRMLARVDLKKYESGLNTCLNFIVQLQGGICKRSGTVFVNPVKTQADLTWLIPFTIEGGTAYVIEMGNLYFRFYTQHGLLVDGSNVPVEVVSPYTTAEIQQVDFCQSADTMFLVHPNHPPQMLQRTSTTSFVLTPFNFQDGPYMNQNQIQTAFLEHSGFTLYDYYDPITSIHFQRYNLTGTITASGTTDGTTPFAPFVSTDVGRWIRILQGDAWGAAQITSVTSSTVVQATVFDPVPFGDSGDVKITIGANTYAEYTIYPTFVWRMGSWSDTTLYPSTVNFHQGRLCFANTPTEPEGFWTSESGIFNLFSPTEADTTVIDSDGIGYTIASNQLNSVQWMLSSQALLLGTYGAEYAVLTAGTSTPLSPSNIAFQQQSAFGSKKVRPYLIGVSSIYVQRSGQKLREMTYDWSINGWRSIEISMLSEHLFRQGGGITQSAYQQEPGNIWWGVRADGTLIGMTYVKEQQIVGFHKHVIGGTFAGGQAVVESITCIPTPDGTQDQLWMVVKRTVDGNTVRYVEFMDVPFDASIMGKNTMNFVDCGIQNANFPLPLGSPASHITGLDHLKGQTVAICADGAVQPSKVVASDGSIDLQTAASVITVGLPFVAQMQTLPIPVQGDTGTGQGAVKRIDRIIFRIEDSLTFKTGKDFNNLAFIFFGTTTSLMDNSPALFTGDQPIFHNAGLGETLGQIAIQSDEPYPLTLLGMSPQLVVQPK